MHQDFWISRSAAEPLAERCGLAFQLTNIIRDVKEDVAVGRVYFRQEDLAQCGLAAADLAGPQIDGPAFGRFWRWRRPRA